MSNANLRNFLEIKQQHMEPFELFAKRLKDQAKKCQFSDPEQMIKNQIIEHCFQDTLKRRAEETDMTLDELISTGIKLGEKYTTTWKVEKRCTRCGSKHHVSFWSGCPALDNRCLNCKNTGHFAALCKFLPNERKRPSCSKDAYSKRSKDDSSVKLSRAKYDSSGEIPVSDSDENGESSTVKTDGSDKYSTSGTNVT